MGRPVKDAANNVENAAAFYHRLGIRIAKYGVRITIVKLFPQQVIDVKIKDRK